MKKLNRHKILSAACIAALPLLVVACLEFDGIIQPGRALTDSEIEVTAQLRVSPGEDGSGKVVFAVLAPKAWNLRDNATLYLTTKDYNAIQHQPEVVNEQLTLMPAEEKDPKNGLSWADSFMSVIGRGGNDPQTAMEWVVWRSSTTFIFDDKIEVDGQEVETADVHADVRIKMKTGAVPLTCELGYSYCYDTFGLKRDEQRFAEAFKPIETYNQVFTTTPSVFRYGDVFGITFEQGRNELVINADTMLNNWVTENKTVTEEQKRDLIIALITLKYTQSNSVCYVKGGQAIGIGAGQQSRIHCTRLAGQKADNWWLRQSPQVLGLQFVDGLGRADRDNAIDVYIGDEYEDVLAEGVWQNTFKVKPEVLTEAEKKEWLAKNIGVCLGSDAFFPFGDNIERAKKSGVAYIAEPGGSIRDDHVIMTCNKYNMAMAFTGIRLFHH